MNAKTLKEKLTKGDTVYGTFFTHSVCPAMVEFIPPNSLDFVIVSAEHNALELAEFLPIRYALALKGIPCLVRTHSRDPSDVSKVCDSFDGVVVPYVEDVQEAKELAAAAVYRPLKGARLNTVLSGGKWPSKQSEAYIAKKNESTLFIPMIESVPAVENLDEICSIPGVNAAFVGPGDLTCSMGIPGEYDHPDLIAMMQRIIDTADRHHVAAGCWYGERRQVVRTLRQGARLVVYSNDSAMLGQAMQSAYSEFRNI
ncbi:HpcH/HpaI aldolase family protein [Lignipirellula cremea]|uniref:5-keto-4-deoxy-D-glucarate aldolase n=1 Tax=Lignipirellula cremea TaxID=2528010 RepID=A0A518DTX9_9BACT|nr:aldolase/citrate lyase family protein [Lignipirellula cremea]QDU95293.1 5-keto-4-deoxy-D-glucarate aldolase [Lignipirellula cremea]